ncbi:MAG: hypothetical protein K9L24_00375 [Spirochaetia bacterium]|nr:hypothetical protein [Spirochaetia bacterium]MCF7946452.1 hypothetical protein [Spirochaetia bacterium]
MKRRRKLEKRQKRVQGMRAHPAYVKRKHEHTEKIMLFVMILVFPLMFALPIFHNSFVYEKEKGMQEMVIEIHENYENCKILLGELETQQSYNGENTYIAVMQEAEQKILVSSDNSENSFQESRTRPSIKDGTAVAIIPYPLIEGGSSYFQMRESPVQSLTDGR